MTNVAELPIKLDQEKIAAFCRARGVQRLSLFGSVLRDYVEAEKYFEIFPRK